MPDISDPFHRMKFRLTYEQKSMRQRFFSANSACEIVEAFKGLERCFKESDLGLASVYVLQKLHDEGDYEHILIFGKKALRLLLRDGSCMPLVSVLQSLAISCKMLNRFDECLRYLTWAANKLEKLSEGDPSHQDFNKFLRGLYQVYRQLYLLKFYMGTNEISYLLKRLKITEKLFGKFSKELAEDNLEISNIYSELENYQESLPFCLKALETYLTCYGDNSDKIATCSYRIGHLHSLIGENRIALDHNRLSVKLSKKLGDASLSIRAEIDAANILNKLGRSNEAVQTLTDILPQTEKLSSDRVSTLIHLAEAFLNLKKNADAKDCAEIVREILGDKENTSANDASSFMGIANIYEELNEFETALSLIREAKVIMQGDKCIPAPILEPFIADVTKRFVSLLLLTYNFEEALPYMEAGVETAKKSFGLKHVEVGLAYGSLGTAYFNAHKLQLAAQAFAHAKDILDKSVGPHNDDSIMMCKSLYTVYKAMGSYSRAMTHLEESIKRVEEIGASAQNDLAKLAILMAELKDLVKLKKVCWLNFIDSRTFSVGKHRLKISKLKK